MITKWKWNKVYMSIVPLSKKINFALPLSKKINFVLEFKMEFMNYAIQTRSQGRRWENSPLPDLKGQNLPKTALVSGLQTNLN